MTTQQTIINGIKQLLYQHDFLVVPGFGGFVLKSSPARFHANGMVLPPMKTVGFNIRLQQDDGVLRSWLSDKLTCAPSEASLHLKDFADYCNALLKARKRFDMPEIGLFYLNLEGQINFEPIAFQNYLTESFGLQAVSANRLITGTPELVDRTLKFEDRPAVVPVQRKNRSRVYVTAIAFVALFFALTALILNQKVSGPIMATLLNKSVTSSYQSMEYPAVVLKQFTPSDEGYTADHAGIATLNCGDFSVAVSIATLSSTAPDILTLSASKYELVAGCFGIKANAEKMVRKLSGEGLKAAISVKQQKGMYVVTAGSFNDADSAEQAKVRHANLLKHCWIRVTE